MKICIQENRMFNNGIWNEFDKCGNLITYTTILNKNIYDAKVKEFMFNNTLFEVY